MSSNTNVDESSSSSLIISGSFSMLHNDENNSSSSRVEREDNVWNFHDDFALTDVGSLSNETGSEKSKTDLNSGGGGSSLFLPK